MGRTLGIMVGSLALVGGLLWSLTWKPSKGSDKDPIVLFCAASNRAVMESIREAYEKECGRSVQIQYGPSQTLLSSVEVSGSGELYLPADDSYLKIGREKGLIDEILPIATMRGVIAVKKGNPKGITKFEDLLREDIRLVQANPDAAAIGKVARAALQDLGKWDALDKATDAYRITVTDVANDIMVGAGDAAIVYDAVLHTYPGLEAVSIPELDATESLVSIGVIHNTQRPQAALHFARYVTARDRGLPRYEEHGFHPSVGDAWQDTPELSIYAGSMLRPAIDETISKFEEREGVRVTRVYNGCGILVAQMQGGQRPDAYFACDSEFMTQVADLFPEPVAVSQNELVILVQKGNPHGIASLKDLTREGLRVGIGHEKQCAMGWLTQNTLREGGVQQEVMKNVTVQLPAGDMLVNELRIGALDAAVAYLSNAAGSAEFMDAIQIQGIPCSTATQPWAVAAKSKFPRAASRLFEMICSADSKEIFEAEGFRWQHEDPRPMDGTTTASSEAVAVASEAEDDGERTAEPSESQ